MKERNSNMELLRLFCIFGIVLMHSVSSMNLPQEGWRLPISFLISSIFDTGVTCFILISGYFGIQSSFKKMLSLATMVWTYSILGAVVTYATGQGLSLENLVKSILPIVSRKYWFITCYFWLVALTPFLNRIPEKMAKKDFEKLLFTLLILFSVIPTFLYFEIMQDAGRGMAHMIMIYLIGRYIRLYHDGHHNVSRLLPVAVIGVLCTLLPNYVLTLFSGQYFAPFTRNSSLTIIISAIAIFLIFKELSFRSRLVNRTARHTLSIYILERTVRCVLVYYGIDPAQYNSRWFVFLAAIAYVLLTMLICIIVNIIRQNTLAKLDLPLYHFFLCLKGEILRFLPQLKKEG